MIGLLLGTTSLIQSLFIFKDIDDENGRRIGCKYLWVL